MPFTGELEVIDGEFDLDADHFVVNDNDVIFEFSGIDGAGRFTVEGIALQNEQGIFIAANLPLIYPGYADADLATIHFNQVNVVDQGTQNERCQVQGIWMQDGDRWPFAGDLIPIA